MNKTILQLKELSKSFKEKKTELKIIDNLSWEVKEQDFIAVLGKSGSGKSTFLNLIGILDKPDSGEIFIENKNINDLKEEERDLLRNRFLGFVFQFHYLLPEFSALENVMMPALINKKIDKKKIKEKAMELLKSVELEDRFDHKPSELSGGEKQRVAIARAFASDPKLIIADEPTANIDPALSYDIVKLLKEINKCGTTVIMVTHEHSLVEYFGGRIVSLKNGEVIFDEYVEGEAQDD